MLTDFSLVHKHEFLFKKNILIYNRPFIKKIINMILHMIECQKELNIFVKTIEEIINCTIV